MKKKLFLLIKYIAKVFKISRKDSAKFLTTIFENYKVFNLPEKHQKIVVENLVTYFQTLVFGVDSLGINKNIRNKHIKDSDICEHLDSKIENLVINCKYMSLI